jgi:hypothetical protein
VAGVDVTLSGNPETVDTIVALKLDAAASGMPLIPTPINNKK